MDGIETARDLVGIICRHPEHIGLHSLDHAGAVGLFNGSQDHVDEFVIVIGQEKKKTVGFSAGEIGGRDVAHEIDLLDRAAHLLDRRRAHARPGIQYPIDRGQAHPGRPCQILGCRSAHVALRLQTDNSQQ